VHADPLGIGRTKGSVLHNVDESLEYRLLLVSRWYEPQGWSFFPQGRYILYTMGCVHVMLAVLRLVAYLVLEFPLNCLELGSKEGDNSKSAPPILQESILQESDKLTLEDLFVSRLGKVIDVVCCLGGQDANVDMEEQAVEHAQTHSDRTQHRVHFRSDADLLSSQSTSKGERKDWRLANKRRVAELPPPPQDSEGACLPIFGKNLPTAYQFASDWKLIWRQLPGMYLMLFLNFSLLGIFSSPFFFVLSLVDHFRYERAAGADVFEALYLGGPRLMRTISFGIVFLIICGFYSYAYFSQTAIIEDESCHSPFQCVAKHILDGFRGDITTVIGNIGFNWTFPPFAMWQEMWYQHRTLYLVVTLVIYNMLLQPIMQGQIVDAFAELRTNYNTAKKFLESKCCITDLDKDAFHDYPGEWDCRKDGEYALRYLMFVKYLLEKDPADLSGLENDVMEAINQGV